MNLDIESVLNGSIEKRYIDLFLSNTSYTKQEELLCDILSKKYGNSRVEVFFDFHTIRKLCLLLRINLIDFACGNFEYDISCPDFQSKYTIQTTRVFDYKEFKDNLLPFIDEISGKLLSDSGKNLVCSILFISLISMLFNFGNEYEI